MKRIQTTIARWNELPEEKNKSVMSGAGMSQCTMNQNVDYLNARIEALESHVKELESTTLKSSLKDIIVEDLRVISTH